MRTLLLERARADHRIVGAALAGSGARGTEDQWSDIDLFFGVAVGEVRDVLDDWTAGLYGEAGALHHFDLVTGRAIYRAFLLEGLLEVDLGFAPIEEFRSHGGAPFRVVFGDAQKASPDTSIDADHLIGLMWHHVLHAHSCIQRGRPWQAEYWISAGRDHLITLACHRLGYVTVHAKGADRLPDRVTAPLEQTLVCGLDRADLVRGLRALVRAALLELRATDPDLADRLQKPLAELAAL